jgi:hypothetical protein
VGWVSAKWQMPCHKEYFAICCSRIAPVGLL